MASNDMTSPQSMKKVDVFINGRSYTINCPEGEEPGLERAGSYINQFIQNIRRQAPQLPQEELLVLCALTLYEKSEQLQTLRQQQEQASDLLNEMISQVNNA